MAKITTNTPNGNITITPNGTGEVDISKVDIDGGTIDGTTIGDTDPAAGTFTTITSTGLAVDTNVLYVDSAANTVGIGTSTPSSEVSSSQSALEISHSNAAALALTNTTGKKYTLYSNPTGDLVAYDVTANTERIRIDSSGNVQLANSLTAGTIGSGVTFPAGHIVQSVMAPTIGNYDSTASTSVKFADVIGQITITSGNGVLIFASLPVQCVPNTNGQYTVGIYEGTIASTGALLAENYHYNGNTSLTTRIVHTMWAYDSSPSTTTPSYTFQASRASSGTTSVQSPHDPSTSPGDKMFYCFLFEIKQ